MTDGEELTESERLLLALLYAPGKDGKPASPIFGRVMLAKLLFLLWKNPVVKAHLIDVDFEPYDYGPWSDWVDVALDELAARDLVAQEPGKATKIRLTRSGQEEGRSAFQSLPDQERAILEDVKSNFGGLSTEALLKYVYAAYPEYASESKWHGKKRR